MRQINGKTGNEVREHLLDGQLNVADIAIKMKIKRKFIHQVQADIKKCTVKGSPGGVVVGICGMIKKGPYLSSYYDEGGFLVSVEAQMLSDPLYGGLSALSGWEKVELYRRLLRK